MSEQQHQNFDEVIDDLRHKDPFFPFYLVMSSGERYLVDDPFMMVVTPSEIIYLMPRSDRTVRLRKSQIVTIEELEVKPSAK